MKNGVAAKRPDSVPSVLFSRGNGRFNNLWLIIAEFAAFAITWVALFGYLFFRLQSFGPESSTPRRQVQRPVMVQPGAAEAERSRRVPAAAAAPASMPSRSSEVDPVAREMDRVLDKISAEGIQSLTPDERRFLDDIARQKRQQLH